MQINKTAGLLPVLCLIGSTAVAEGFYVGAKAGWMDADVNGLDEAVNVGAVVGYTFANISEGVSWGIEGEATTTTSDGDVDIAGFNGDWDIDTQAIYGVLRLGNAFYGKLRLGYLWEDVSVSVAGASADGNDDGVSGGVGAGMHINEQFSVEAEYTYVEEDINFYSVGVNFSF